MKAAGQARHAPNLLWLGMFGPPVVWSLHFLLCYYLASVTSSRGAATVRIELSAITAVALAFIALCGVTACSGAKPAPAAHDQTERLDFMRRFALLSAPLFFVAALFTFAPVFVLGDF